jgi:hypothetical protein
MIIPVVMVACRQRNSRKQSEHADARARGDFRDDPPVVDVAFNFRGKSISHGILGFKFE